MQNDWIVVKTAPEIALKSDFVRSSFMKALEWNIKNALSANGLKAAELDRKGGRIFFKSESPKKALKILHNVFGIHALALAERHSPAEMPAIETESANFARKALKKGHCFAVRAKLGAKKSFNAHDIEVKAGDIVRKAVDGVSVNLSKPDVKIIFEVFDNEFYVYAGQEMCFGGLPVGVSGRIAFLASKKPAEDFKACWLLLKRGCELVLVGKSPKLAKMLEEWNSFKEVLSAKTEKEALEKGCVCFASSDSRLDEKSAKAFEMQDAKIGALVLRPLLLFPKELFKGVKA